jgi:hypothetical protein
MTPPHDTTPDTSPEEYHRQQQALALRLVLAALTGPPAGRTAAVAAQLAAIAEDPLRLANVAGQLVGIIVDLHQREHGAHAADVVLDQLSTLTGEQP